MNIRIILLVAIVVAILLYLSTLLSGGGLNRSKSDGFSDLGEKQPSFTLYYMNGCPHCEVLLPEYRTFAASGQFETAGQKVKIRMLEQGEAAAAPELEANNVKGFPTLVLNTTQGKNIEYSGERTVPAMKEFITKNVS
jgi:hypothetical protein